MIILIVFVFFAEARTRRIGKKTSSGIERGGELCKTSEGIKNGSNNEERKASLQKTSGKEGMPLSSKSFWNDTVLTEICSILLNYSSRYSLQNDVPPGQTKI